MSDQVNANQESNVVSIFAARKKLEARNSKDSNKQPDSVDDLFADIIKKNLSNTDRQSKDRNKSNKSVLRSYKLKSKK